MALLKLNTTSVYIVYWESIGVVKGGVTILPSRVRKFVRSGATVLAILHDQPLEVEKDVHRILRTLGPRAFTTWQEGVSILGAGGTGFSECYKLPPEAVAALRETLKAGI